MRTLVSASLLACALAISARPAPPGSGADALPPGVAAAFAGIVSVRVHDVVKVPVFRGGRFLREPVEGIGAGSGVVVSDDGLILTNAHVIAGATRVDVTAADGREMAARVLSVDDASDLALLQADGRFRPIPFAGDGLPDAGSVVYVLGNRADLGPELAWGRMGAHRALHVGARPLEFWAEVEAPIGPGNSGGAILDASGRLVGIPSLLVTYTEESEPAGARASGLFIPARHARRALDRMRVGPRPVWPWIGVLLDDPLIASSEGRAWDMADVARVRRVFAGSPADEAGLRPGDRIVAIADGPARDTFEALDAVLDLPPGRETSVEVERGGRSIVFKVTPAPRPADPRPDPLDDFALHTGFRLEPRPEGREGRPLLALAGMSTRTRRDLPEFEAALFDERPALVSILPGQNALEGRTRRIPVLSDQDLSALIERCFVEEQFVALIHWDFDGRKSLDRAHVHRKVYPIVL